MLFRSGTVTVIGHLADGTAFTYASGLNAENSFPLHLPLYTRRGGFGGTLMFNTTAATRLESAGLVWYRPPINGVFYPLGWPDGIAVGFDGSARNLVTAPNALPVGTAALEFSEGGLDANGLSQPVTIKSGNRVPLPVPNPRTFAIVLRATGAWGGSFFHPITGRKCRFHGAVLDDRNEGAGFFLGGSESGRATFVPGP